MPGAVFSEGVCGGWLGHAKGNKPAYPLWVQRGWRGAPPLRTQRRSPTGCCDPTSRMSAPAVAATISSPFGAMLNRHPAPATHCPARAATRHGVTAPPSNPLTKGVPEIVFADATPNAIRQRVSSPESPRARANC